jgi:hypothetical protein
VFWWNRIIVDFYNLLTDHFYAPHTCFLHTETEKTQKGKLTKHYLFARAALICDRDPLLVVIILPGRRKTFSARLFGCIRVSRHASPPTKEEEMIYITTAQLNLDSLRFRFNRKTDRWWCAGSDSLGFQFIVTSLRFLVSIVVYKQEFWFHFLPRTLSVRL